MIRFPCSPVVLLLVCASVTAQVESPATRPANPATAPFVFEAGEVELGDLIGKCASYLQQNIQCDGVNLNGTDALAAKVVFDRPVVVDRDGCEDLLTSVLWRRGLAVVPMDESKHVCEVIPMNGPRRGEITARVAYRTAEQVLARPNLYRFVIVVYSPTHLNSLMASNAIRPLASSHSEMFHRVQMTSLGPGGALVLTGSQHLVAGWLRVLQAADKPALESAGAPPDASTSERLERIEALLAKLEQRLSRLEKERPGAKSSK